MNLDVRLLAQEDPPAIAAACQALGWKKTEAQYQRYLREQMRGTRTCFVARLDGEFAGYVTVNWQPSYCRFAELRIPEVQDLNVLPRFRRKGIATRLLDRAEHEVRQRSQLVGIAFGLHPGYNNAQRLYVKRGYIPDGFGVTYRDRYVQEAEKVVFDDNRVLHLTKQLDSKPSPT